MPINLSNPSGIPESILSTLANYHTVFSEYDYLDYILERRELLEIVEDLNELCEANDVIGFHYTRGFRNEIEAEGLVIGTGAERRENFLSRFGSLFSSSKRLEIQQIWNNYFDKQQDNARDNRVWFALTKNALDDGGAARLLAYYGGEVVYMPLTRDDEVARILRSIGDPMIVKCKLATSQLNTFTQLPWGKVWLSTYHCSVNPRAFPFDVDVYSESSIPPQKIIAIESIELDKFEYWI